jgi:hypothetical protein
MDHADLVEQLEADGQTTVRSAALARRARARLTAIKSFCKNVSSDSTDAGLERKQQAAVRSNIYNALTPALLAMHDQLCALEHRARRLMLTNVALMASILALIAAAIVLS